jgi:hypothetical protein
MKSFDELNRSWSEFVRSAEETGIAEGLRDLLSLLYPDNAHFIYEILQNAEDARARQILFRLEDTRLIVDHDGERQFGLGDVNAIVNIGHSTKANDPTTIGQFGVGFKAVFAYTDLPQVHSGEFSFAIRDLFVPERIEPLGTPGRTIFIFPFNRPDKPRAQAVDEVARGLRDLGESTVMFLKHMRKISYVLPNGERGTIEREDLTGDQITIRHAGARGTSDSRWLRLTGQTLVEAAGKATTSPIAAAFRLREDRTTSAPTVVGGTGGWSNHSPRGRYPSTSRL